MITDVILSGLTNLFALFGATKNVDVTYSTTTLSSYLSRHFGIRNVSVYLDLYDELRELYSLSPDLDKDSIIHGICENFVSQLRREDQHLILLRLMEFCTGHGNDFDSEDYVFRSVQKQFGISDSLYDDFCHFIENSPSEHVSIQRYENLEGFLTVLWLTSFNKLIFTYHGTETVLMDDVPVLDGMYQTWSQSGVLKVVKSGLRIYYSTAFRYYANETPYESIAFCGRDINLRFPGSANGMHDLSFDLSSGQLLAIMGGSGTGKTTLLSLLNGTLKPQSGTITINGHSISEPSAKSLIGFVPQDDLLIEELTVYENLYFTARLCFDGMPASQLEQRVTEMLRQLDLLQTRDLKVGSPLEKTISGGQRKRLNIALELIREPVVLFLDEPTSGLSSSDTEKVVNLLKEQTYKGKLIVVNIHQPSSDVYKLFDRLWLLDKGGYPVFDGNPIDAITYFKTAANYADADSSTCPTCGNVNPEVILNIIDEKALDGSGKLSEERKVSPQEWHKMYVGHQPHYAPVAESVIPRTSQRKPGVLKQFAIFLQRNVWSKKSNLQYILITLLQAPVLAAVCALLTHYSPQEGYSVMDNKNLVSYLFMAVIVAVFLGMSGSAEEIIKDRLLLKREKFLDLSYKSYISSKIIYMAGVAMLQTLLFVVVGNSIMGVTDLLHVWWGILFLVAFLSSLIGLLLSQCLNSVVAIYITIPILLIPQILLCGLVVNFSDLTPRSTTGNVPVIGDVIPSRWAYEALAVTQFKDNAYEAPLFEAQKEKYETQYYRMAYLYELQSQLETMRSEQEQGTSPSPVHIDVIKNSLPRLSAFCAMPPYSGNYDYASLRRYTDEAERLLAERGNRATLAEDRIVTSRLRTMSSDAYRQLKRDHYNLQLENLLVAADSKHTHDVVDGHIVPRVGFVFLTPQSRNGRAPFYSPLKVVGQAEIPTLWFNTLVLMLFSLVLAVFLYTDCPGRYMRTAE